MYGEMDTHRDSKTKFAQKIFDHGLCLLHHFVDHILQFCQNMLSKLVLQSIFKCKRLYPLFKHFLLLAPSPRSTGQDVESGEIDQR
jgi:hypothetical protein